MSCKGVVTKCLYNEIICILSILISCSAEDDAISFQNELIFSDNLELGVVKTLINDELYDLRDNRGEETAVFLSETQNQFDENRISLFVVKRANTIAIAGMGKDQRVLVTDEFLYTSTTPHEIGHALGLFHTSEEGNIMSRIRPYARKEFTDNQVYTMKETLLGVTAQ